MMKATVAWNVFRQNVHLSEDAAKRIKVDNGCSFVIT